MSINADHQTRGDTFYLWWPTSTFHKYIESFQTLSLQLEEKSFRWIFLSSHLFRQAVILCYFSNIYIIIKQMIRLDDKEFCNILNEKLPKAKYIIWNSILNIKIDNKVQKEWSSIKFTRNNLLNKIIDIEQNF